MDKKIRYVLVNYEFSGNNIVLKLDKPVYTDEDVCIVEEGKQYKNPILTRNAEGEIPQLHERDDILALQRKKIKEKAAEEGGVYTELVLHSDGVHVVEAHNSASVIWIGILTKEEYAHLDEIIVKDGRVVIPEIKGE